jgi:two-component system sensor histidine kinase UhpB
VVGFEIGLDDLSQGTAAPIREPLFVVAVLALGSAFILNFLVLKAALLPVLRLQETARKVRAGDLSARVDKVMLSDTSMDALIEAFNAMLDSVERNQKQFQTLSGQVLQAQEEERKRVARELHDETAQALTALLVRLRLLSKANTLAEAVGRVEELRDLTAHTLDEVRHLALELRCAVLDDLGLVPALNWYVDEFNRRFDIRTTLQCTEPSRRLPPEVELCLYRVVQEALTNVARHAGANNAWVSLRMVDESWADVTIEDDGHGFDVEEIMRRRGGLGVFGMRERVALLGGEFWMNSAPGSYTRVRACVPIYTKRPQA